MVDKIQIYADGASPHGQMEKLRDKVSGWTTNPSLCRQMFAGNNYVELIHLTLNESGGKPVSVEVFADDFAGMERQARYIAACGSNAVVKIPITNSEGEFTGPLIEELSAAGIPLNITAIFTMAQVVDVLRFIRKPGAIISIFAGRIADTGLDPEPIVRAAVDACRKVGARVLWASTREVFNVIQAERCGADIITMAPALIEKLNGFGKDLTVYSLETVRQFKKDSEGFTL